MNSFCSFHLFIFAASVIFLRCLSLTGASTCHPDDEAGLLAFKAGITEDPSGMLSSWKKCTDCCSSWQHVFCPINGPDKRVHSIRLEGSDDAQIFLTGTISPSLVKLQHLEEFYLFNLNISGSFPQFLFRLPKLKSIVIVNNRLSGPLPANINALSQLHTFSVVRNRFSGPIPSSLSKIPSLSYLYLGGNLLTGTIPSEFANLKHMEGLDLSHNHLSGKIPDIFKSMTSLRSLQLSRNRFSGKLPPWIAHLSVSPLLTVIELGQNNLSGSIPSYISRFESLQTLDLSHNQFSGVVPKSLAKLTKLANLDLSYNLLTDPFPVLNVKGIGALDLSYNRFHLKTIPKWVTSAPFIYSLKLAKCGIKMSLNQWKPKKTALYDVIDLSENQISGTPAKFLEEKDQLRVFQASENKLRFDMGKLNFSTKLETLDLSRNLVFGKVPVVVAGLKTLNLSQNHLCGKLPVTKFPANVFSGNDCLCDSPLAPCKL